MQIAIYHIQAKQTNEFLWYDAFQLTFPWILDPKESRRAAMETRMQNMAEENATAANTRPQERVQK